MLVRLSEWAQMGYTIVKAQWGIIPEELKQKLVQVKLLWQQPEK
jgi:hypothetical protein